jgi:hypothetical protein
MGLVTDGPQTTIGRQKHKRHDKAEFLYHLLSTVFFTPGHRPARFQCTEASALVPRYFANFSTSVPWNNPAYVTFI